MRRRLFGTGTNDEIENLLRDSYEINYIGHTSMNKYEFDPVEIKAGESISFYLEGITNIKTNFYDYGWSNDLLNMWITSNLGNIGPISLASFSEDGTPDLLYLTIDKTIMLDEDRVLTGVEFTQPDAILGSCAIKRLRFIKSNVAPTEWKPNPNDKFYLYDFAYNSDSSLFAKLLFDPRYINIFENFDPENVVFKELIAYISKKYVNPKGFPTDDGWISLLGKNNQILYSLKWRRGSAWTITKNDNVEPLIDEETGFIKGEVSDLD